MAWRVRACSTAPADRPRRRHLLHPVQSATALAELCIGDVARITHTDSPQYLYGAYATIVAIDGRTATVQLQRPVDATAAARSAAWRPRWTKSRVRAESVVQQAAASIAAVR